MEEARAINECLHAFCVLNAADATGRDNDEAAEVLRDYPDVRYLDSPVVRRKVFPNSAAQGRGVLEYTPKDQKALDEIAALMTFVYQDKIK
jgi:chromosome partitioning protein